MIPIVDFCLRCKNEFLRISSDTGVEWLLCPGCGARKIVSKNAETKPSASTTANQGRQEEYGATPLKVFERMIGSATIEAVKHSKANCVVMLHKSEESEKGNSVINLKIVRDIEKETRMENRTIEMEPMPLGTIAQIRMIIRKAVDENILIKGDNIIVLADETLGIGFDGLFLFFKIDEKFMELTARELKKELKKSVLESVMEIAREIGREGREGKKIGTAFIIGDHEKVIANSRQMILNPMEGHPLENRNVTDVGLKETIKALAQLDGAFVIDNEGYIHAAGRYLSADTDGVNLQGLGCRHTACAAITKISDAVAVAVSESGGIVRVFKGGNLISEEKG